mgnify:CR=1 FL=1
MTNELLAALQPYLDRVAASAARDPALRDLATYLENRIPGPDVTPDQLRSRSWWSGAEVFVLVDDYEPSEALADEIKGHVRERLSAYAYPRRVEFVSELPKTLTGKIRRIELRQLELERAGTDTGSQD